MKKTEPKKLAAPDATYEERIAADKRDAQAASLAICAEKIIESRQKLSESLANGRDAINALRGAGLAYRQYQDRDAFSPGLFNATNALLSPKHREVLTASAVKESLRLAANLEKPVETVAETNRWIQGTVFALEFEQAPHREGVAGLVHKSYGTEIPLHFAKLNGFLQKMEAAEPIASASAQRLETLKMHTEYAARINAQVKERLKALEENGGAVDA